MTENGLLLTEAQSSVIPCPLAITLPSSAPPSPSRHDPAMAITQIHTHRRNRQGSWRNGEGGALDASQPHSGHRCAQRRRLSEEELRKRPRARLLIQHVSPEVDSLAKPAPAGGRSAFASAYAKAQPSPQA